MPQKRQLLRLPHVFGQVLELPLRSNADVFIQEKPDCIRFIAKVDKNMFDGEVKAHAVKIHPGVTKIVVRGGKRNVELLLDKLEVDVWRFRLPDDQSTRVELATAVIVGKDQLVVTIPKGARTRSDNRRVWWL